MNVAIVTVACSPTCAWRNVVTSALCSVHACEAEVPLNVYVSTCAPGTESRMVTVRGSALPAPGMNIIDMALTESESRNDSVALVTCAGTVKVWLSS
jgi:hypothetical protein